ncbi:hypothetical protein ACWHA6_12360 [Streptomyces anthocyanicus]|uniref:hypothetical protein n=1 Tax=Streptomyces anthocyanicus TaxID=68174 RepID=UPI003663ECBB
MGHAYAVERLTSYLTEMNAHLARIELAKSETGVDWPDWPQELAAGMPLTRGIVSAYTPHGLSALHEYSIDSLAYWQLVRMAATEALGHARSADELAAFLRPTSPAMAAYALHPWV